MARTYRRDSNGRFASGGGGAARPKARSAPRGPNRLTRDNAGRITSVGGEGATARGGRLRTAGGNLRGTVLKKGPIRATPSGAIRKSDVWLARKVNAQSKMIERRDGAKSKESFVTRAKGAERRIADQKRRNTKAKGKALAKYKLTPNRLSEKLTEYDHSKAMRAIMNNTSPYSKESKRRSQTVNTAKSAASFRQSLDAESVKYLKATGKDWAKARVKAFQERPVYSTKQKIRRSWGPRTNPSRTTIKGW